MKIDTSNPAISFENQVVEATGIPEFVARRDRLGVRCELGHRPCWVFLLLDHSFDKQSDWMTALALEASGGERARLAQCEVVAGL